MTMQRNDQNSYEIDEEMLELISVDKTPSFVFYKSNWDAISCFPDETKISLLKGIFEFAFEAKIPTSGIERTIVLMAAPSIKKAKHNKVNGSKRHSNSSKKTSSKTTASTIGMTGDMTDAYNYEEETEEDEDEEKDAGEEDEESTVSEKENKKEKKEGKKHQDGYEGEKVWKGGSEGRSKSQTSNNDVQHVDHIFDTIWKSLPSGIKNDYDDAFNWYQHWVNEGDNRNAILSYFFNRNNDVLPTQETDAVNLFKSRPWRMSH